MATLGFIEYEQASAEVRAIYDDIMATRKTDWINNFWKALAHDPATLGRTWESVKVIMAPGALDVLNRIEGDFSVDARIAVTVHNGSDLNRAAELLAPVR